MGHVQLLRILGGCLTCIYRCRLQVCQEIGCPTISLITTETHHDWGVHPWWPPGVNHFHWMGGVKSHINWNAWVHLIRHLPCGPGYHSATEMLSIFSSAFTRTQKISKAGFFNARRNHEESRRQTGYQFVRKTCVHGVAGWPAMPDGPFNDFIIFYQSAGVWYDELLKY